MVRTSSLDVFPRVALGLNPHNALHSCSVPSSIAPCKLAFHSGRYPLSPIYCAKRKLGSSGRNHESRSALLSGPPTNLVTWTYLHPVQALCSQLPTKQQYLPPVPTPSSKAPYAMWRNRYANRTQVQVTANFLHFGVK